MRAALLVLTLAAGCAHLPAGQPLQVVEGQPPSLQVRVAELVDATFVVDIGAPLPLISRALCAQISCRVTAGYEARGPNGEERRVPLAKLRSLRIAGRRLSDVTVGVIDFAQLGVEPGVEGVVSLSLFRDRPVTIDTPNRRVILESSLSLERRLARGYALPLNVETDGPATRLVLPPELHPAQQAVTYDLAGRRVIVGPPAP